MEQILVYKKTTAGTFVLEAETPEDALWGATRTLYLNKVVLGQGAKTPKKVKVTVEILESYDSAPEA